MQALDELTGRAEQLMRANIADLPDGTITCEDYLDNDGITDVPLKIALDLTISGESMTLDFSRSSPPCDGPLNIALLDRGRLLLRRAEAHLSRMCRPTPAASRRSNS